MQIWWTHMYYFCNISPLFVLFWYKNMYYFSPMLPLFILFWWKFIHTIDSEEKVIWPPLCFFFFIFHYWFLFIIPLSWPNTNDEFEECLYYMLHIGKILKYTFLRSEYSILNTASWEANTYFHICSILVKCSKYTSLSSKYDFLNTPPWEANMTIYIRPFYME